MVLYLGLLLFSFIFTSVLIVPFIGILYRLKFFRRKQETTDFLGKRTTIFDRFHRQKAGTPVGGGLLIIGVVTLIYLIFFPIIDFLGVYVSANHPVVDELNILFFSFISFGLLGLYDDTRKFFDFKRSGFFGLRMTEKFLIQVALAAIIATMLYVNLGINFVHVPFIGVINLGWVYVPLATLIIVIFTNAFNITDGLDGLSSGLLMICLISFWILSYSVLDTVLGIFIGLWLGSLIAFLYFNVYPARIMLGDVGALSFGATLAVMGLLLGKIGPLFLVGGLYLVEFMSSLIQIISKKFFKRRVFKCAPFHLWLQNRGWEEPKIVMRAWLAGIMLAVFGLWLALWGMAPGL